MKTFAQFRALVGFEARSLLGFKGAPLFVGVIVFLCLNFMMIPMWKYPFYLSDLFIAIRQLPTFVATCLPVLGFNALFAPLRMKKWPWDDFVFTRPIHKNLCYWSRMACFYFCMMIAPIPGFFDAVFYPGMEFSVAIDRNENDYFQRFSKVFSNSTAHPAQNSEEKIDCADGKIKLRLFDMWVLLFVSLTLHGMLFAVAGFRKISRFWIPGVALLPLFAGGAAFFLVQSWVSAFLFFAVNRCLMFVALLIYAMAILEYGRRCFLKISVE
ncbi:MAG: hypothetical protein PHV34_24720 [Verrucomicrobiae bacterium]|nr:hypothetical protein [Verrucomicrobiae bacterium]